MFYRFTSSNFNGFEIKIEADIYKERTAKKSIIKTCKIQHVITSLDPLYNDPDYATFNFTMSVTSIGCGIGEYTGEEGVNRELTGSKCVCNPLFWKPPVIECQECPDGVDCKRIGTGIPPVSSGWWRHDPSSSDFDEIKLYECKDEKAW